MEGRGRGKTADQAEQVGGTGRGGREGRGTGGGGGMGEGDTAGQGEEDGEREGERREERGWGWGDGRGAGHGERRFTAFTGPLSSDFILRTNLINLTLNPEQNYMQRHPYKPRGWMPTARVYKRPV